MVGFCKWFKLAWGGSLTNKTLNVQFRVQCAVCSVQCAVCHCEIHVQFHVQVSQGCIFFILCWKPQSEVFTFWGNLYQD